MVVDRPRYSVDRYDSSCSSLNFRIVCCFRLVVRFLSHGTSTEDCPEGHTLDVGPSKKGSSICAQCFYTMRGSFPSAKLADMKDAMENHASVSEKCLVFSIVHPFFSTCFNLHMWGLCFVAPWKCLRVELTVQWTKTIMLLLHFLLYGISDSRTV